MSFAGSADLTIAKTAPASVLLDGTFVYTVSVDNAGPSTASNVVVTDVLPAGVEFVSAVASVGTFTVVSNVVTWNLGTVAVADPVRTLQITVHVLPTAPATLVNTASVTSSTADPNSANNLVTTTTTVVGTDLWISKAGVVPAGNPSGRWSTLSRCTTRPASWPTRRRRRERAGRTRRRTWWWWIRCRSTTRS